MKEIKNVTKEIEEQAYENVEGFNFTELCFKSIFEIMNCAGVFRKTFNEVTTYEVINNYQIELEGFKYYFVQENDGKVYPAVDWIMSLSDCKGQHGKVFVLTLTPFNACLDNETKNAGVYGGCDKELTKVWRIAIRGFFKDKWVEAFKKYCGDVKNFRESEIATKAEIEYLKNELCYEDEINSI